MRGLRSTTGSAPRSGGRTTAAATDRPICGAASPTPLLKSCSDSSRRRVGGPFEDGAAGIAVAFERAANGYFRGEGRLDAPDLWIELDRKVQPDGESAGGEADGTLEPLPPLLLADRIAVLDGGAFAGI